MKRKRINDIYTAVIEEAKKQQLATSELLVEYMADLNVVSKYNCYSFCFLPHTIMIQSPWGSLAVDSACAVTTRGEAAQVLGSRQ